MSRTTKEIRLKMSVPFRDHNKICFSILIAEDDETDRDMLKRAWSRLNSSNELIFVNDGEELMKRLVDYGRYSKGKHPDLIVLDLNMPHKDGYEVLREIKENQDYASIPIVVHTTSTREDDIRECYALGCNAYMVKSGVFDDVMDKVNSLDKFWFKSSKLPNKDNLN